MEKSIQNGVVAGIAGIIIYLLVYFIKPQLIFNLVPWLVFAVVLYFMWKSASDQKQIQGGFIQLRNALKYAWLPAIIAITIVQAFRFILIKYIDPNLIELQLETIMKQSEKMLGMFGGEPDGDIFDNMEEQMRNSLVLTFPKVLLGILLNWIMHFFPALAIAAILRKKIEDI